MIILSSSMDSPGVRLFWGDKVRQSNTKAQHEATFFIIYVYSILSLIYFSHLNLFNNLSIKK